MKIKKGLVFSGNYFKGRVEVMEVDEKNNILKVHLTKDYQGKEGIRHSQWSEEWNLVHTQTGFTQGEYFKKSEFPGYPSLELEKTK
jgi:hypothetical protein